MRLVRWGAGLWLLAVPVQAGAQVDSVQLSPTWLTVTVGDRFQFSVQLLDAAGRPVGEGGVHWSVSPSDAATVDSAGWLRALHPELVRVVAEVGGRSGVAYARIVPGPVATVEIRPRQPDLVEGGMTLLDPTARTREGHLLPDALFTWQTNDPRVATVDPAGVVTARGEGTAILAATSGAGRGETRVRVVRNRIERLTVTGPVQARTGEVVRFRVMATDRRGLPVEDAPVRWAVNSDGEPGGAVEIGADGGFVASEAGRYLVSAIAGSATGTRSIVVEARRTRPVHLEHHGRIDLQDPLALAVGPGVAWVSTGGGRLYTIDLRDPARPRLADSLMVAGVSFPALAVSGDRRVGALVRQGGDPAADGVLLIDLSNPLRPQVLSEIPGIRGGGVAVDGGHLYLTDADQGALRVFDISNPLGPVEAGGWRYPWPAESAESEPGPSGAIAYGVLVHEGLAFVAFGRDGLVILDVGRGIRGGTPAAPTEVSRHRPPRDQGMTGGVHATDAAGSYLFVAELRLPPDPNWRSPLGVWTRGLVHVLDIRDPGRPVKVAQYAAPDAGSHSVRVEDDVLYVGAGAAGARLVDVSGELRGDLAAQGRELAVLRTRHPEGSPPNLGMAWAAEPGPGRDGMVLVADRNSGLWIVRLVRREEP